MTVTNTSLPSVEEILAEADGIDRLMKKTTERINSPDCDLTELLHLELCKAEQRAYMAGLLYALGHPTILDRLKILSDLDLS